MVNNLPILESVSLAEASEVALVHQMSGRFIEADEIYRVILSLHPDCAELHKNHGHTLLNLGRLEEAKQAFEKALTLMPDSAEVCIDLGKVLMELEQFESAEQVFRQAVILAPDAAAFYYRGNALTSLERWQVAEKNYRQAIALEPDYFKAYGNLGNVLRKTGRLDEAERAFLHVLSLVPEEAKAKFNLSLVYLLQGRIEEGFQLYEQRFEGGSSKFLRIIQGQLKELQGCKRWEGECLKGMSLLILTEQGAGDSLMMLRYLTLIKEQQCLKLLVVYCEPHLKRIFQSISAVDEVVPSTEPLPIDRIDSYCSMMSLPHLFQTRLDSIPDTCPYLLMPDEMKNKWRIHFKNATNLKVGLVWAGDRQHIYNSTRSISLRKFSPLLNIEGVQLVSLQKGEDAGQLKDTGWEILDLMDMCDDYLDTASLVYDLDLVISVDTSVAHLAGALGKPVWLLNCFESEWRWMLERSDSPWYPHTKIFRQTEIGNWDPVIQLVTEELSSLVRSINS